jgi:hypothetical protein
LSWRSTPGTRTSANSHASTERRSSRSESCSTVVAWRPPTGIPGCRQYFGSTERELSPIRKPGSADRRRWSAEPINCSAGRPRSRAGCRSCAVNRRCHPLACVVSRVERSRGRIPFPESVLVVAMVGRHKRSVRARVLHVVVIAPQTRTSHPSGSRRREPSA